MTEYKEPDRETGNVGRTEGSETGSYEECESIKDPVRRSLCKACGLPVVGEAPFCKDHEPPVP